jgi:CRP-like cAMP-binding protein
MANTQETVCKEDGREYNYKFVVTGTFVGDKGEHIDKERILDVARMSDKSTAWEWLWNADFELTDYFYADEEE